MFGRPLDHHFLDPWLVGQIDGTTNEGLEHTKAHTSIEAIHQEICITVYHIYRLGIAFGPKCIKYKFVIKHQNFLIEEKTSQCFKKGKFGIWEVFKYFTEL